MPDLADRISRAAVAALDLAPFDDRYGRLSRQVLAGGASRFARVTADDQALHFVIPVGLAGERLEYGALVLQDAQVGVLWRDAHGLDHSVTLPRASLTSTFSTLTLGGEHWTRFDVAGNGEQLAFLVPPVSSPLLRTTLIDFLRARPGGAPQAAPHPPEPEPEPALVRFPDPEPTAVLPVVEATPEPADPGDDATQLMPVHDDDATQLMQVPAEPALPPGGDPPHETRTPQEQFAPEPALLTGLYRDEPTQPPDWAQAPTQALPPQQPSWNPQPPTPAWQGVPSAELRTVEAAPAPVQPTGASRTTVGFLLGLFATLAVGGAIIIFRLVTG